ncbi:MAG: trigger factor [Desulfovibrionaceae bacterium]|nr:trigger factor [Desulfovibrionaceae bacterium]
MQYASEDLSPVKKKITVTVPAEEVNAAISATLAMYRTNISLDGFRKGKVPASIIEKRFHGQVYKEATTDLVNVHINEIIGEGELTPVSRIDYDGGELARDHDFVYSISFEVLPEFDLPAYEGFAVEQEESEVDESEVSAVVERLRSNMGEIITVGETREPKDGEIAVVDFEAFDENGAPIAGVRADNFQLTLGDGQTLPDFETLVKSIKTGEEKEGQVAFPADFFNPEFAGRTVSMKAKLHAIKEKKLPELDEAFARKAGGFESMDKLRDSVRESYVKSRTDLNKAAAQKQLLDQLLKLVDFPVPDSMLENHVGMLVGDIQDKLERQGKNLASLGKTETQIREEVRPEAEMRARSQILLLTVARKKSLAVSEEEVDLQLRRLAMQSGQDYNAVKDYYTNNNLLFALRDRLLADKAMDELFSKADVKMVPPKKPDQPEEDGESKKKASKKSKAPKAEADHEDAKQAAGKDEE